MRCAFESQGINDVGKIGGPFFDQVKIKGLLFNPSSWELIGFVDLDNGNDINKIGSSYQEKLATHVLQFFLRVS